MYERVYGVSDTVEVQLIDTTTGNFFTGTLAAGDAKVSKNGGVLANAANLPVQDGTTGKWLWTYSTAEISTKRLRLQIVDQTATKAFYDVGVVIETTGNASAQYPNRDIAPADVSALATTAQLTTVEGKVDLAATTAQLTTVEGKVDSNGTAIGSLNDFDYTTEQVIVATNNDKTGYTITGEVDLGSIKGSALTETNVGNLSKNYSFFYDINPTTTKTVNDVGVAGAGLTAGQVWEYATRELTAAGPLNDFDPVTEQVIVSTNNDKTDYSLSAASNNAIVAAIVAGITDGSLDFVDIQRALLAAATGVTSGAGTGTVLFKDPTGTKNRITVTTDTNKDRATITLDLS